MRRVIFAVGVVIVAFIAALFWQARTPPAGRDAAVDILSFFEGASVSTGTIRTALVRRQDFTATFEGVREGSSLRLEERFAFPEGERLQVWRLTAEPDGRIVGTVETEQADGSLAAPAPVEGRAGPEGTVLEYKGIAPGGGLKLSFRHTMRAVPVGTVSNHVAIALFGIPIANSTVRFAKDAAALSTAVPGR